MFTGSHAQLEIGIMFLYALLECFINVLVYLINKELIYVVGLCSKFPSLFYSKFLSKSLHYAQFYSFLLFLQLHIIPINIKSYIHL